MARAATTTDAFNAVAEPRRRHLHQPPEPVGARTRPHGRLARRALRRPDRPGDRRRRLLGRDHHARVTRLTPAMAVVAMEEAITLVQALSSGGVPVTFEGQVYRVSGLEPAPVPAPPVWTGTLGPKALAVTGR